MLKRLVIALLSLIFAALLWFVWWFVWPVFFMKPEVGSMGAGWHLNNPTPLMRAAAEGNVSVVQALLDRGHNVNEQAKKAKATPLIFAASAGRAEVVNLLLARGANPNLCSVENVCPIWWAIKSGSYETAKLLVEAGADVNRNPTGYTTLEYPNLHEAVVSNDDAIVRLLLDRGAEIDYTNFYSENTALAIGVALGKTKIAQLLIERDADLTFATEVPYSEPRVHGGKSALQIAEKENYKDVVELVERALISGKHRLKYTVGTVVDKLYKDTNYDLPAQGEGLTKFLRLQTQETLRHLRNTIFARKNYIFDDPALTTYFQKRFPTYKPATRDIVMSDIDKRNVQYMKEIEEYRAARDAAG